MSAPDVRTDVPSPFPVSGRAWDGVTPNWLFPDAERLPLPPTHAARVKLIDPADAARLYARSFDALPRGWPEQWDADFPCRRMYSPTGGCNRPSVALPSNRSTRINSAVVFGSHSPRRCAPSEPRP